MGDVPRHMVAQLDELAPGRLFLGRRAAYVCKRGNAPTTVHLTDITEWARGHYHKAMTESLRGPRSRATHRLGAAAHACVTSVIIKPGCRHSVLARINFSLIPIPTFDPQHE